MSALRRSEPAFAPAPPVTLCLCGMPLIQNRTGGRKLYCAPCRKQRRREINRDYYINNHERELARHRAKHATRRKHNPAWHEDNKRRCKEWRKRNAALLRGASSPATRETQRAA